MSITAGSWIVGTDTSRGALEGRVHILATTQSGVLMKVGAALTEDDARLMAASPDLLSALDPETLDAIADEIENSARADSLRVIARKQRAAIGKVLP